MRISSLRLLVLCQSAALVLAAVTGTPGFAQVNRLMRYNSVAETVYLLDRCGVLTPARKAYLREQIEYAMVPIDFTAQQWAAHDANLSRDLQRLYPGPVPKVRCDELSKMLDSEMKVTPRR